MATFQSATSDIVKELCSKGDLFPLTNAYEPERFRPLCLVTKTVSMFKSPEFCATEYKVTNLVRKPPKKELVPKTMDLPTVTAGSALELGGSAGAGLGAGIVAVDGSLGIKGSHQSGVEDAELYKTVITKSDLRAFLESSGGINMDRPMPRELLDSDGVCVVLENVITRKQLTMKDCSSSGANLGVKAGPVGNMALSGSSNKSHIVCVKAGTVLAYKVCEMSVRPDGSVELLVLSKDKTSFIQKEIQDLPKEITLISEKAKELQELPREKSLPRGKELQELSKEKSLPREKGRDTDEKEKKKNEKDQKKGRDTDEKEKKKKEKDQKKDTDTFFSFSLPGKEPDKMEKNKATGQQQGCLGIIPSRFLSGRDTDKKEKKKKEKDQKKGKEPDKKEKNKAKGQQKGGKKK
ncbi:gasdermin-A2 isoform X2 [Amia ocellicauda]|uniref:gasdermin-A2 isoform X2 n=1 Tax=Amia ocellicauda TaxID=2972642 RepID=UPI0034639BB6